MNTKEPTDEPILVKHRRTLGGWLAFVLTSILLWAAGLIWFAETLPAQNAAPETDMTDAVVVLTGSPGRLSAGIDLLARKRAKQLFISGVYRGVDVAQILRLVKQQGPELECCMTLGHAADDTKGNATETARWAKKEGIQSLRLVTASYHMRRSLLEFGRLMPHVQIIAHPIFPTGFKAKFWWRWPGTLRLLINEYTKYLVALMRLW
ncbi:MAG: YdcF family protein [Rhodospirillales bacterium]|jgi:uncharacterized SAM-binding protein YcdF (DUF218 family)|nr:YdcF family protein [Rhodospirillales bacterium]MBT4006737.1 YdcF family protein [Rhodospirillales bacterium]MBT5114015.1 YdcF family protein [Rhodospirillales bacterium]MBT5672543.1 YdcF family protein [Rhodospirillales bacterium]MBT6185787.1 YdcF family protein [Rhodospirillales bacterium]